MSWEDIGYGVLLAFSIGFGPVYRKIANIRNKQWIGTLVGFLLVLTVSGGHVAYSIICTIVNAFIITRLSSKVCHIVSFFFSFFFLFIIFRLAEHYGLPAPPGHTNLVQMIMTLKLAGMAHEVNSAALAKHAPVPDDKSVDAAPTQKSGAAVKAFEHVSFLDVVHYSFSYMGVMTGPYYSYRTYWDSLHRPFSNNAPSWDLTKTKLLQCIIVIVMYFAMDYMFPVPYVKTEEFSNCNIFYRFAYIYPTFITFKMRMYSGMGLAECGCRMSGLGAYPDSSLPTPGGGPKSYEIVEELTNDVDRAKKEQLNFNTICNIDAWGVESCILLRTAMKKWNACVQYWMAMYIYKKCPIKPLKTVVTMVMSSLWHGYALGYFHCIGTVAFYLPIEDIYSKFHNISKESSVVRHSWAAFLWFMKTTITSYLGMSFRLLHVRDILAYYRSIYFAGHFACLFLFIVGVLFKPYILRKKST